MTLGFVLIFFGIQLNLVESYELTPRFSNFLSENGGGGVMQPATNVVNTQQYNSPYYQASYPSNIPYSQSNLSSAPGYVKTITPPSWLCWPVLFLGAVLFLHGLSKRRY